MYPKFLNKQSKTLLKRLAKNENKMNYRKLPYKILVSDGRFHKISFLKQNIKNIKHKIWHFI